MKIFKLLLLIVVLVVLVGFIIIKINNNSNISALHNIKIEVGMQREEVEKLIANVLKTESGYSVYNGSTISGDQAVKYTDGVIIIEVVYNPGAPAPWVINSEGVRVHYPPVDQTVKSFRYLNK